MLAIVLVLSAGAEPQQQFQVVNKCPPTFTVINKVPPAKRPDCGCTYSAVPKGLLGSPCTCNPTGQTPCVCGGPDYGPDVEIKRGALPTQAPVQYVQVCEGGVCRVVATPTYPEATQYAYPAAQQVYTPQMYDYGSYAPSTAYGPPCANGQCPPQTQSRPRLLRR